MINDKYVSYKRSLSQLGLGTLSDRRETEFCHEMHKKYKLSHMFPLNQKNHKMETRHEEKYMVQFAHTTRLKNSPLIYMQKLLNQNEENDGSGFCPNVTVTSVAKS